MLSKILVSLLAFSLYYKKPDMYLKKANAKSKILAWNPAIKVYSLFWNTHSSFDHDVELCDEL